MVSDEDKKLLYSLKLKIDLANIKFFSGYNCEELLKYKDPDVYKKYMIMSDFNYIIKTDDLFKLIIHSKDLLKYFNFDEIQNRFSLMNGGSCYTFFGFTTGRLIAYKNELREILKMLEETDETNCRTADISS